MESRLIIFDTQKDVAFATISDNKPKLRVFQVMKRIGNKLFFATAPHKQVHKQLQESPFIEILSMNGDISLRANGIAQFDVDDTICRDIYNSNPVLSRLYLSYTDLVYFSMEIISLDYYDLTTTPPTTEHYGNE